MSTITTKTQSSWDLSPVFEFVNTLTSTHIPSDAHAIFPNPETEAEPAVDGAAARATADNNDQSSAGLGDFSRVWQFLGTPKHSVLSDSNLPASVVPSKDDYASDGAVYPSKRAENGRDLHWADGTDGEEPVLASSVANTPALTKTQRKKARRQQRKLLAQAMTGVAHIVSESEAESVKKQSPARRASAHAIHSAPSPSPAVRLRNGTANAFVNATNNAKNDAAYGASPMVWKKGKAVVDRTPSTIREDDEVSDSRAVDAVAAALASIKSQGFPDSPSPSGRIPRYSKMPEAPLPATPSKVVHTTAAPHQPFQQVQNTTPKSSKAIRLIPSSVQPASNNKNSLSYQISPGPKSSSVSAPSPTPLKQTPRTSPVIEPKIVRSGEDRHWALLMKIIGDFYEDRKYLLSPMNLTTHNNDPNGIHLFVDASNIFIGFMDQLKYSRGIHPMAHVSQANLSFDGLGLLMERRRPVAKRVLVGSNPHLPAFDKAKAVGYECNILEKVYKARELTERQIYFKNLDARRMGRSTRVPPSNTLATAPSSPASVPRPGSSGGSSGSETTAPQFAPAKMIEQGVDEILQMKMLESIVDAQHASTMVLATGDGAAAEYSPGFQRMVERALEKGWSVELVSWSRNINSVYKRKTWTDTWGDRFRIICLDDYAEELLEM